VFQKFAKKISKSIDYSCLQTFGHQRPNSQPTKRYSSGSCDEEIVFIIMIVFDINKAHKINSGY
jgi:hypothetical protein